MNITKDQYLAALKVVLKEYDKEILQTYINLEDCKASSQTIAKMLGISSLGSVNLKFGKLGRRVSEFLNIYPSERASGEPRWWSVLAEGENENNQFAWKLRRPFIEALHELAYIKEELALPEDLDNSHKELIEGAKKQIVVNAYERNKAARDICIKIHGLSCQVCDMNFEETYGEIGKDFIHVHHINPLAARNSTYQVNPEKDLIPVCPNCHAMLHKENPLISIERLREIVKSRR